MRSNNVCLGRRPVYGLAVLVLVALTGSACAGGLAKYRNAQPLVGATQPAAETAASAAGAESAAGPVDAAAAGSDRTAGASAASAATAPSGTVAGATGTRVPRVGTASAGALTTGGSGPAARTASSPGAGSAGPSTAGSAGQGPAGGATSGAGSTTPGASGPAPGAGTTTGVTKDSVTVGFFYPKTGAYTGLGRNFPAVVQAAVDEAGPINGRRVVLKFYDDGTANASTIQVEEKRAKDEAFAFISVVSESNVVLAPLAEQHKVPVLMGNMDEKVALPLTYSFPLFAYWSRQAAILPGFIKNALGAGDKKIGIVYEGTSTAIDAKNTFKDKAKGAGLSVVFEQPISQNQSTCANEVANLQSHGVQLVYMMNGPLGGICMLRDARALGYKPIWTGVGVSWNFNVVAQASGGGADGIRTLSTVTTLETPAGRHFSDAMRQHGAPSGAESDDVMLLAYSILQSAFEALRRAGPDLTREGFVQTMETKMNGYDSGYLPPPTFGPKIRYGPTVVGVSACCTGGKWATPQSGWRAEF
ncbi:MAG TPA: ABC transporter substrate-binding protein [Acidimicrobiia bacterium]|jgi:branched-chain amino acid transport system substrate-binding protein|nr:ABC transporter substrate-binding protein [Acidimicrobiia bacterium]